MADFKSNNAPDSSKKVKESSSISPFLRVLCEQSLINRILSAGKGEPLDRTHHHSKILGDHILSIEGCFAYGGDLAVKKDEKVSIQFKGKADNETACSVTFPGNFFTRQNDKIEETNELKSFLNECDPSPFGFKNKTVIDENIRKAFQIPADRILSTSFDPSKNGILEIVRRNLVPFHTKPIDATLDKLNIYGPGCFFEKHRDTPRDELCFGTLVVCLPSRFGGGELDIWHTTTKKVKETFRWDSAFKPYYMSYNQKFEDLLPKPIDKPCLQWAAFFGHCEHEIKKVTAGYRVALTYLLRYDPDCKLPQFLSSKPAADEEAAASSSGKENRSSNIVEKETSLMKKRVGELKSICRSKGLPVSGNKSKLIERIVGGTSTTAKQKDVKYSEEEAKFKGSLLFDALARALEDPCFFREGGLLGVPCLHLYERDEDLPPIVEDIDEHDEMKEKLTKEYRLKGSDAFVYICANLLGLFPQVIRLATESVCSERYLLPELPSFEEARSWAKREMIEESFYAWGLSLEDLGGGDRDDLTISFGDEDDTYDEARLLTEVKWAISLPSDSSRNRTLSQRKPPIAPVLDDLFISTEGYYGNESSQGTVYTHAAIVFKVPPTSERFVEWKVEINGVPLSEIIAEKKSAFAGVSKGLSANEEMEFGQTLYNSYNAKKPWNAPRGMGKYEKAQVRAIERERREYYEAEYGPDDGCRVM